MHWAALFCLLAGTREPAAPDAAVLKRLEYQQTLMGVPVKIVVYAHAESPANAAVHEAFDRIRRLNLIFSDYDDDSEIAQLGRASGSGQARPSSPELCTVLGRSLELSRSSDGAFDVTIGPLVELWRKSRRSRSLPSIETRDAARQRVGYRFVKLDQAARTVELQRPGMRLDFGGIVKGYAADEARRVLAARGFKRGLVALSGDISAGDPPPGEAGWRIAVENARNDSRPQTFIRLRNQAVSTSGDAYQFVEIDGRRYSHLVDPRTGLGSTRRISVTVVANRGIDADGLDSTIALLGLQRGKALLEQARGKDGGIEGRIVEAGPGGLQTFETPGFARLREVAQAPPRPAGERTQTTPTARP
jgi:thiamine biosynthesis lipoprotein